MGRREPERHLRRRVGGRRARRTLLVFCEGRRTEPEYLQALRRLPSVRENAAVEIRIDSDSAGFSPLGLVRKAVSAKVKSRREEAEIDEFWCVFDVEWPVPHADLSTALRLAAENDVALAVSNPCFEIWLVLHLEDHQAWLDSASAQRLRRKYDGRTDKGLASELYLPLRAVAASRAARLERRHAADASLTPHDNPSSGMHRLLAAVESRS